VVGPAEAVPADIPAESNSVLPVTGQDEPSPLPFMLIGLAALLFVVGGGILLVMWRLGQTG
jgi:hypothetical protein